MKRMMENRKARGISGVPGMFKNAMAKKQSKTLLNAQKGTPAFNAQSTANVPDSEEERRRKSMTSVVSTNKLG